jgi:hypothetical protein
MKKTIAIAGMFLLGAVVMGALSIVWLPNSVAQEPLAQVDVVMMRCATGSDFSVKAYEGSTNAPAKKTGKCPETVSQLMREGFSIESVGYFDDTDKFIAYTLIRSAAP